MDTPASTSEKPLEETPKKAALDSLSKEDLVKKCKGLLVLAQKAKQAKIDVSGELEALKEKHQILETQKLSDKEGLKTMQELVMTLTEQKLSLATEVDSLKKANAALNVTVAENAGAVNKLQESINERNQEISKLKEQLSSTDTEKISLLRQNGRMEAENEDLLRQLDDLEKKIEELNDLGMQQRQQLLDLEASSKSGLNATNQSLISFDDSQETTGDRAEDLSVSLSSKVEQISMMEGQIVELKTQLDDKSTSYESVNKKLSETLKEYEVEKVKREKSYLKLKSYREKIVKCSSSINQLKNSKFVLLKTVSDYSESIPRWQKDIVNASKMLSEQLLRLESENEQLKLKLAAFENSKDEDLAKNKNNEDLQRELNRIRMEMEKCSENVEKEVSKYDVELNKLKKERDSLLNNVQSFESEKLTLVNEKKSARENVQRLESEKAVLHTECDRLKEKLKEFENETKTLKNLVMELEGNRELLVVEMQDIKNVKAAARDDVIATLNDEIATLKLSLVSVEEENKLIHEANDELKREIENLNDSLEQPNPESHRLAEHNNILVSDISRLETKMAAYKTENASLLFEMKESRVKLSELEAVKQECESVKAKLASYKCENAELLNEMKEINEVLKERGETISKQYKEISDANRRIQTLKDEVVNLKEENEIMKGMNEKPGERERTSGDGAEMDAEEERKAWKLEKENLEALLKERDGVIISLNEDLEKMKQNQGNPNICDARSETMSVSTISRVEESSRLKDIDESFEERYSKLRLLALKLKKRVGELTIQVKTLEDDKSKMEQETNEMSAILKKAGITSNDSCQKIEVKNSNLQMQQPDKTKPTNESAAVDAQNNNQGSDWLSKDSKAANDRAEQLKKDLEFSKKEKASADIVVKELQNQISNLKKELEAIKLKNAEVDKLKGEVSNLKSQLDSEASQHQSTRELLERARRETKKKSVLSLEMEDYERSMKDLTTKMDDNKKKMVQMESTIDTQGATINSLKTQIKMLDDQLKTEEKISKETRDLLSSATDTLKEKEVIVSSKNEAISRLEADKEELRLNGEEIKVQLAAALSDGQKNCLVMEKERSELIGKLKKTENRCKELEDSFQIKDAELEDIKAEFNGYKVRAQAVLRQNQTKDLSLEENLKEEMAALKAENSSLRSDLQAAQDQVTAEKSRLGARCGDLQATVTILQGERDGLLHQVQTHAQEMQATKLQMSTLAQCYTKQLAELEDRKNSEITNLRKELDFSLTSLAMAKVQPAAVLPNVAPVPPSVTVVSGNVADKEKRAGLQFVAIDAGNIMNNDPTDHPGEMNVALLEREEGEGSESTPSPSPVERRRISRMRREPLPLEQLLETGVPEEMQAEDLEGELEDRLKAANRQIHVQNKQLSHMMELVGEAEREVARHSQLEEALKEEVRRCQRALDRALHHHNQEYLKNVIMKFLTLSAGDERVRLVPVLNTILTLSPEETQQLNAAAKGLEGTSGQASGWTGFLPWSAK